MQEVPHAHVVEALPGGAAQGLHREHGGLLPRRGQGLRAGARQLHAELRRRALGQDRLRHPGPGGRHQPALLQGPHQGHPPALGAHRRDMQSGRDTPAHVLLEPRRARRTRGPRLLPRVRPYGHEHPAPPRRRGRRRPPRGSGDARPCFPAPRPPAPERSGRCSS